MLNPAKHAVLSPSIRRALDTLPAYEQLSCHGAQTLFRIEQDRYALVGPDDDDPCRWLETFLPDYVVFDSYWVLSDDDTADSRLMVTLYEPANITCHRNVIPA